MTKELKCISNKQNKAYVIPTNDWLKPIEPIITDSVEATMILAKLIDKEKVLVRITNNSSNKLKIISSNLSEIPNFPYVYCVITCNENIDILDANYIINDKPAKGFCNGKSDDGKITLEIMKYYKKNYIKKFYDNKLDIIDVKHLLDQAISAQLLAFEKFGFVHNDIHLGNIIINKEDFEYNYNFKTLSAMGSLFYKTISGKNNFKIYIVDFGNSEFLLPEYRSLYIDDYYDEKFKPKRKYREKENTLPQNIYTTILTFLELNKNFAKYKKIMENHMSYDNPTLDYYNYLFNKHQSMLFYSNDYNWYIKKNLKSIIMMINDYYNLLFKCDYIESK